MEWLEAHARLEQKRKSVLRRQQREIQRRRKEAEARQRELEKLAARCREMQQEERLSVQMEAWYRNEEERKKMEIQRLEDLKLYATISKTRKRVITLGLSESTPGIAGLQRLHLLEARIAKKELALKKSHEAKVRLDALPGKRSKLRELMHSFFLSGLRKKIERAVYHQHWDHFVPLLEPGTATSGNRAFDVLNHESENGFTPVLVTIFKRKQRMLRKLLELGASPNVETKAGMTPLLAGVMTGDIVAVSILMEFKVDLNYETKTHVNAVLLAVDKGREEILRGLLEYGANVDGVSKTGRSTLIQAAISGSTNLVRVLLAYGASKEHRDGDGKDALEWATQLRNSAIVSMMSSSITSVSLMTQLKTEEQEEGGEVLSSLSTNRVIQGKRKAEMEKVMRDADIERIRELLSIEGSHFSPNYEDARGNSPLLVVCSHGSCADVVFCLRKNCIPIHQNYEGLNALMVACKRGNIGMISLLLKCGCNLLTQDFGGRNAYHYLNSYDHPDLAIQFTKLHREKDTEAAPALTLGTPLSSMSFLKSEYSISLIQADISFGFEGMIDRSVFFDETESEETGDHERKKEESDDNNPNPAIRKWRIKQETLKRHRHRRHHYEAERERILAVRTRGRRNGLIAPLSSDPAGHLKFPTCYNCQISRARKQCFQCEQVLCDRCHARLHELVLRRHHSYEELKPKLFVGHEPKEIAQTNQENSLQYYVKQSECCVTAMRSMLAGDDCLHQTTAPLCSIDDEVETYHRKKRLAKEKAISQMQINVPVAAAKRAAQAGEEVIYAHPAELDLAKLYTTQKKYAKAQELLVQVEKLITDSLGILHPTMLKVAIGKTRILLETDRLESCASIMQDAISLFEGILSPDHNDMLVATSILLQSLDLLKRYAEAVQTCRHAYSIRSQALPATHKTVLEIQVQLDEFISKRETVAMHSADLIVLAKLEEDRKRMEELANESERHLADFRKLLMEDPEGLATFLTFARQEFAEDLIGFWIAIEQFKEVQIDSKTLRSRAVYTFLTYIKSRRIKVITAAQRKKIKKAITTPGKKLQRTLFDDVQAQIFDLVYKGVYVRYLSQAK